MMQEILVFLIVFCALVVSFGRYAPKSMRRAIQSFWPALAKQLGFGEAGKTPQNESGACGGCGTDEGGDAKSSAGTVARISPDALKRTLTKR